LTLCVIAALTGFVALADEEQEGGTMVTLSGEIEVAEYDDDGNTAAVMVYDQEWGSVLVAAGGKGDELLDQVGAIAKLTGKLTELDENSNYGYSIRVSSYSIEVPADTDDLDSDDL